MNELIFFFQTSCISLAALVALWAGSEALVAFICLNCVLANLFVLKQITLCGLTATAADAFTIGATIGLNLLQEYFGKAITRKTIGINFFILIFYALMSAIHIMYAPCTSDTTHTYYVYLLSPMPRIVIASFTVYFIAQLTDYVVFGFLKRVCKNKLFILRNYGSIMVSQLVDTVLFSFLGLYGLVSNIWQIILVSYTVKLLALACATPAIGLSAYLRKKES